MANVLTHEMLDSIKKVEASRASRIGAELRRMTAEEKQQVLNDFHPDYKSEGFYVLVNLTAEGNAPKTIGKQLNITEGVVRNMIVAK